MNVDALNCKPEQIYRSFRSVGECYFIVDKTILGRCWGGVRVAPDLNFEEVKALSRAMTLKTILAGIPIGGAKTGVRVSGISTKEELVDLVSRTVGAFLKKGTYFIGTDIGFTEDLVNSVYAQIDVKRRFFSGPVSVGEGCAQGILTSIEYANRIGLVQGDCRTVALEGFGKMGIPTARLLYSKGFEIVAVSNLAGTLFDSNGLDISELIELSTLPPERMLSAYLSKHNNAVINPIEGGINFIDAHILIPGARSFVIDEGCAQRIRAKVVCPISNAPVTSSAEKVLARRRIVSIPDIISNTGGLIAGFAQHLGADASSTRALVSEIITRNLESVLAGLPEEGIPKKQACLIAQERLQKLSKHEMVSSLDLLTPWFERLGPTAVFRGLREYISLKIGH